jgi:hypothetical protein
VDHYRAVGWVTLRAPLKGVMLEEVEPFAMMVVVRRRVRGRAMALN